MWPTSFFMCGKKSFLATSSEKNGLLCAPQSSWMLKPSIDGAYLQMRSTSLIATSVVASKNSYTASCCSSSMSAIAALSKSMREISLSNQNPFTNVKICAKRGFESTSLRSFSQSQLSTSGIFTFSFQSFASSNTGCPATVIEPPADGTNFHCAPNTSISPSLCAPARPKLSL